ncbi:MAG TPA: MFS transporter [Thermoanaerobaculia bacterium]|jgi:SHS family lactate transporter-like MFS transporter|nr:MFS transporter [Thermoanaerobaculia bacterium]
MQPVAAKPAASHHAVLAGFLGWTLDAFDFFVIVFMFDQLAAEFGVPKKSIIWTVTMTLLFRPIGALLFGFLADRFGRRGPLMANVVYFSIIELLSGFSQTYTQFLVLRALFGIGMGGEWGVGASLAMEQAPKKWRGVLSGILQSGYSIGYLLAALASRYILPVHGWRWMFWIGALPALLALYIRTKVPESKAWQEHRVASFGAMLRATRGHARGFAYLVLLMTFMMFLSHGTQDLYPDFLKEHGASGTMVPNIAILYNVGAVIGAVIFGQLSQRMGRRYSMMLALALSLCVIPFWAFGTRLAVLAAGAVVMQMGVQGAWGIIPVHLNELAPDAVRGLMPGLAYQLGILFAAPTSTIEHALRDRFGYSWALAGFELVVIVTLTVILFFGREDKGRSFHSGDLLIERE